jgi:hypothetical protein
MCGNLALADGWVVCAGEVGGDGITGSNLCCRPGTRMDREMTLLGPLLFKVLPIYFSSSALMPITKARLSPAIMRARSVVFALSCP